MPDSASGDLFHTVLHDWHVDRQAKMVDFGGWHMPVQYPTGIIREHLAVRRGAGVFDVCHMGRFRVRGDKAERFLGHTLTNSARRLKPGQAQYTFIANEDGGALDDAYLYKLEQEDFLLVVNAANREKDAAWLRQHRHPDAELVDVSEDLGMLSLQGPQAQAVLENLVPRRVLPENKRNRLATVRIEDRDVVVARTGYTGESVCFELFVARAYTEPLWEQLVAHGAVPAGLGARDSLRLEAGLPLYGHELGRDPEGTQIPIFANGLALFGVRAPDSGDYIGRTALERQRAELIAIRRGELSTPVEERVLRRLVQPVAAFGSRRPMRQGFKVFLDGRHVGFVTSGTTVPYARFDGDGIMAAPAQDHELRPIGLALIDSDIRYRSDRPVALEVADERGKTVDVELVERNLWPTAPYARPYQGFQSPPPEARIPLNEVANRAGRLARESKRNTTWRQRECVNLIPSEQTTSAYVNGLCVADPAGRYNEHNRLPALGPDAPDVRYYKGTAFIMEKEEELKAALRTFFDCSQVEARVISGQMANDTVYDALKQFKNRHCRGEPREPLGRVLVHDLNKGGHLSAQVRGALKNYVAIDPNTELPAVERFPIRKDNPHRVDVEQTKALIAATRPELIVLGRSVIIHREPVREIAELVHQEFGADNPRRPLIMYDGAHVLGLLGPHYQMPLAEGADVITGSTHKTFFGPQRGVILSNIGSGSPFEALWRFIEARAFPGHVSNHHLGTMLGLLGATYEMLRFKDEYPLQVIRNAKAFARALHDEGLELEGDPGLDYTETHQVLLRAGRARGEFLSSLFEQNNVITNPQAFADDLSFAASSGVRMGTQEMTRYGMREEDFRRLAGLLAEMMRESEHQQTSNWRSQVQQFRSEFTTMQYCL